MRGSLPKTRLQEIHDILPKLNEDAHVIVAPGPGVDIYDLIHKTKIGISLVCLNDAIHRLEQVNNALHEAFACKIWYTEFSNQEHHDIVAIATSKFYMDYATLLLYATAEDISFFLVNFLGIEDDLRSYTLNTNNFENKGVSSNAAKVGIYLSEQKRHHFLTKQILRLPNNPNWKTTLNYRNTWVHDKPPIIAGLGVEYDRRNRITTSEDGTEHMHFGGGSHPDYMIENILNIVLAATILVTDVINQLLQHVKEYRQDRGEIFQTDKKGISFLINTENQPSKEAI